ncbi:aminoglycoside phosphotransferase [Halosimplex carlsbadense 2-9-1]|uniref:Aminoglycoside phosphotransferase n=1 Tax=Halosimplex carlsbadense 2-9-1 TaxID=797114 RepID=M0CK14_9EURY|nr:phosphotransferase [Halosimplex carlsbadense]ELZ23620.1 aminoglycoside phosphotransferase [Halosimplex carlsbadense 2-9-1]
MTDPKYGPRDPLSAEQVAAAVAALRADWTVLNAEPMPAGSDIVYGVTVRDGEDRRREVVLKCFRSDGPVDGRSPERFLVEVDLLELVGRETAVPVPTVYGAYRSRDGVPVPAFLMERLPGEAPLGVATEDRTGAADRLLGDAGRFLARIHDLRSFDTFGHLVAGESGPTVRDGQGAWRARLRDIVDGSLDGLAGTRFADLEGVFREYADGRFDELDLAADAALLHGDYRPGNLLADPETGEPTAVLDWGAAQAGDPRYELAWAVREFSERAPVGSAVRERVRETLLDAYEDARGVRFERDEAFERRQSFYLAVTWMVECRWFDAWWGGADESAREARAERLRKNVTEP